MRGVSSTWLWTLVAAVGAVLALAACGVTVVASATCQFENTDCADDDARTQYIGRLFDHEGRPARHALVFRSPAYGRDFSTTIETDGDGRFCVSAVEGPYPTVAVPGQRSASRVVVRSAARVDPRFRRPAVLEQLGSELDYPDRRPFIATQPQDATSPPPAVFNVEGARELDAIWDDERDRPATCQDVGDVPWHRSPNATGAAQFLSLVGFSLLTVTTFVLGLGAGASGLIRDSAISRHRAKRLFQATTAAAVVTAILFVALGSYPIV